MVKYFLFKSVIQTRYTRVFIYIDSRWTLTKELIFLFCIKKLKFEILTALALLFDSRFKGFYRRFKAMVAPCFHKPPVWCPDIIMS